MLLAPLGSAGLIFNVIFSNILLGSKITRFDVLGTLFIIVGGILVSYFGAMDVGSEFSCASFKLTASPNL